MLDEKRRNGFPRTDEERKARHNSIFGTGKLPPRGTGLGNKIQDSAQEILDKK